MKKCEHISGKTENIYKRVFFGLFKKRIPHMRCDKCNELIPIKELLKDSELAIVTFED